MDNSSILGMPMSPQEIFKRYKRQSLGMPMHPLFINKSTRSSLNALYFYFFIYYVLFLERLYFCLLFYLVLFFCFVCCNKWLDPIIRCLGGDALRFNCIEHSSFHFYRSTSVLVCLDFVKLLFFTLICVQSLLSFLYLGRISSLIFVESYL